MMRALRLRSATIVLIGLDRPSSSIPKTGPSRPVLPWRARSLAAYRSLGFDEVERIVCFRKELAT